MRTLLFALFAACSMGGCHLIFQYEDRAPISPDGLVKKDAKTRDGSTIHDKGLPGPDQASGYCTSKKLVNMPFAGGSGSQADPFRICTVKQLAALNEVLSKGYHFRLMASLDMAGSGFAPFTGANTLDGFKGSFDGSGQTLANLTLDQGGTSYIGLFRRVLAGGTIKDLNLRLVKITGGATVGALASRNLGRISGCIVSGLVRGKGVIVGGLVGWNQGTISGCTSAAGVEGEQTAASLGGLAGVNYGTISNSSATGAVTAKVVGGCSIAGGLVGTNIKAIVSSYATGEVYGGGAVVGGLVGDNSGTIMDSYASGSVRAGAAGSGSYCADYSDGSFAGGLVGVSACPRVMISSCTGTAWVKRSYATGKVDGKGKTNGGLVGLLDGDRSNTKDCFSTGNVLQGAGRIGGLIGDVDEGKEAGSYWDTHGSGTKKMCGDSEGGSGCSDGRGVDTSQPGLNNYFQLKGNPPLKSWDFSKVWKETAGGFPRLR